MYILYIIYTLHINYLECNEFVYYFQEKELEDKLQNLATDLSQLYKRMAPDSFENQVIIISDFQNIYCLFHLYADCI